MGHACGVVPTMLRLLPPAAQGFRDSGIGSQGVTNSLAFMCKTKVRS